MSYNALLFRIFRTFNSKKSSRFPLCLVSCLHVHYNAQSRFTITINLRLIKDVRSTKNRVELILHLS